MKRVRKPPTAQWTVTAGGAAIVDTSEEAVREAADGSAIYQTEVHRM
jgi:hypothetical protein